MVSILLTDDSDARNWVQELYSEELRCINASENPQNALAQVREFQPETTLIDLANLDSGKLETVKSLSEYTAILALNISDFDSAGKVFMAGATGCVFKNAQSEDIKLALKSASKEESLLDTNLDNPRFIVFSKQQCQELQSWNVWFAREVITLWRMRSPIDPPTVEEYLERFSLNQTDVLVEKILSDSPQPFLAQLEEIVSSYRRTEITSETFSEYENNLKNWIGIDSFEQKETSQGCIFKIGLNVVQLQRDLLTEVEKLDEAVFGTHSRAEWLGQLTESINQIVQQLLEGQQIEQRRAASARGSFARLVALYNNSNDGKDSMAALNALFLAYRASIKMAATDGVRHIAQTIVYRLEQYFQQSRLSDDFLRSIQQELTASYFEKREDWLFPVWQQYLQQGGAEVVSLQADFESWSETKLHRWGERAKEELFSSSLVARLRQKVCPHTLKIYCDFLQEYDY